MELSTILPAELAAIADPSARGAAPLLTSADSGGNAPPAALPFALCLELLTEPSLSGEAWPADGKDLPLAPTEGAVPTLEPTVFLLSLPTVPTDAPLAAMPLLAAATESGEPLPSAVLPLSETQPAATLVSSTTAQEQSVVSATPAAPTLSLELESAAAAADTAGELAAPRGGEVPAKPPGERTWLEAFMANDARTRAPQPAPAMAAAAATTSMPISPAAELKPRAAEIPPAPTSALRSLDEFRLTAPVSTATDTPSFGQGDWLPQAGASAGATNAAATPVPSTSVDVRTPSWQEAFASRVQWLVETQAGEARIKLNPPELGAVDVKISLVDDKTYVQLTTATAAARDELAQSLPRLRELLTLSGLEVGGASVHNGRDQHPTGDGYRTAADESRSLQAFFEGGDEAEIFLPRRSLGRIDVFA